MRPPINRALVITQLFGGWPQGERFVTDQGFDVWGHPAIDISCPEGTQVYAMLPGIVTIHPYAPNGLGNSLTITKKDGSSVTYGHLSRIIAAGGVYWPEHAPIALSGNTGNSTGPHLHVEWRPADMPRSNGWDGCADWLAYLDPGVYKVIDNGGV